jgi:F-type H+-transporting ATPase subunit delta
MAELATIARPYAEALFKAAGALPPAWPAWLERWPPWPATRSCASSPTTPRSTPAQVFDVVTGVLQDPLPKAAATSCAP